MNTMVLRSGRKLRMPNPPPQPQPQPPAPPRSLSPILKRFADMAARRSPFERHLMTEEEKQSEYDFNMAIWMNCANIALKYYNSKQGTDYECSHIQVVKMTTDVPKMCLHICFLGKSAQANDSVDSTKLFFAELKVPLTVHPELETELIGCCTLKKIDSAEAPKGGKICCICGPRVPHPSPKHGYCPESGDMDVKYCAF